MPEHNRPGSIYSTHAWKGKGGLKEQCFTRDGFRCRACGRAGKQAGGTVTLSAAHKLPERVRKALGRPITVNDLVTLCLSCHGKLDGGRRY